MKTGTLLVVDDNQENLFLLQQVIKQFLPELALLEVGTAEEGYQLGVQTRIDVALIDVQLPGMDGIELCRRFKANEDASRVPIILITGYKTSPELKADGLAAGADDFLLKPIDNIELVAKIKAMLRIKRSEDELRGINARLEEMVARRTQELRDSLQASVDIVLAIPSGLLIFEHEPPDRLVLAAGNPAAEKQLNAQIGDWCGKELPELLPSAHESGLTDILLEVIRTGENFRADDFHYADGRIDAVFVIRAFRMPGNRLGVALDNLGERNHAQEASEATSRRYRDLVENAGDMICALDLAGDITYASRALLQTLGYAGDELVGRPARFIIADEDYEVVQDAFNTRVPGESSRVHEFHLKKKDGGSVPVEIVANPVHAAHGKVVGMQAILRDVSRRKALEHQLLQSQKMEAVGRLAAGVAHDFNNLLTAITGYSELVLNKLKESDPVRREVEEIRNAGQRASALTRQLLAFSRKQVLEPTVLELNGLIAHLQKMLCRLLGEDIDLITVFDPTLGRVKADPGQIETVIMNLAVNSRDAMPQGGKLVIETVNVHLDESSAHRPSPPAPSTTRDYSDVVAGPYVLLAVSDTGVGMTPETLSHIFEPFFTTKEHTKGTGLGLSTVYGIVRQSGGHIRVHSEPGAGTTFRIYLPRVGEPLRKAGRRRVTAADRKGSETVLLVEDEDVVRNLARAILQENGYHVLEARHGGDALLMCEQHKDPIALLVTDVVMPGVSGDKLGEYLTSLRPEMKVLYMSGHTDMSVIQPEVLNPSNGGFIQKPFSPEELNCKVREILDQPPTA